MGGRLPGRRSATLGFVAGATLFVGGCSVDGAGLVAGEVIEADGATVVTLYSLGAGLRTRADDAGLTLGYSKRAYVFPAGTAELQAPGWHLLYLRLPAAPASVLHSQTAGLEVRTGGVETGLSLGYRESARLTAVAAETAMVRHLSFRPGDLAATRLRTCSGEEPC